MIDDLASLYLRCNFKSIFSSCNSTPSTAIATLLLFINRIIYIQKNVEIFKFRMI